MIPARYRNISLLLVVLVVAVAFASIALFDDGPSAAQTTTARGTGSPAATAGATAQATAKVSPPPAIPADGELYAGVDTGPGNVELFDTEAGISRPAILGGYVGIRGQVSDVLDEVTGLRRAGTAPLVSWGVDFTGGTVAGGGLDAYLLQQAREIAAYPGPVFLRPDWEMTGTWYPQWSLPAVTPAAYVAAWRHVFTLFQRAGATNAAFVWNPNVGRFSDYPASAWYPGDAYVNWLGVDAYPRAATGDSVLTEPDGLNALAQFAADHGKPVMLAEWGPTLPDPDAVWVFDLVFEWAARYPDTVKALVYFDYNSDHGDHLLAHHPVGAAEFRYLLGRDKQHVLYSVSPTADGRTALQSAGGD